MTPVSRRDHLPPPLEAKPIFDWFFAFAVLLVIGIYIRAIYFTPIEAIQGPVQKIYYLHVPAAVAAYVAVSIMALASLVFLWLGDDRADRLAGASAEVGLMFIFIVLTTGPLWAKQQWGAYWVWWDMRLTLTLFLAFVMAAYLVLRGAIEDEAMRTRYSAVLGVLAALLIPFIHLSVYLFQARLHPMPVALKPGEPSMSPEMVWTFFPAMVVFSILCIAFIRARYRLSVLRDLAAQTGAYDEA
jgi:heme exporter protein C